jgi:RHS repeat-associated protein
LGHLNRVTWRSQSQEYRYDPYDRLIAKIQNHRLKSRYVYGFGRFPLAELNKKGRIINVFLYASGSTPIVMRKRNAYYYIVSDIRGSVRLVVKGKTGEIRQRIEYDTFGQVLEDSRPGYTPFGFAGGLYDYRTKLVRFGARDYNPEIGRWTAEDPIRFLSGDVNFYAYVGNDPVNYVDLDGLSRNNTKCNTTGLQWNNGQLGSNDLDWRGRGNILLDALNEAFSRTGVPRDQFRITNWGKNIYGKSQPVEWVGPNGAEISIDLPHYKVGRLGKWESGPDAPHVGWKFGKPKTVGHILLDEVPCGR